MSDPFLATRIASFLLGRLDDVSEIGDANAFAANALSHGLDDSHAVHERDALVQQLADDLADALTSLPGQQNRRAA